MSTTFQGGMPPPGPRANARGFFSSPLTLSFLAVGFVFIISMVFFIWKKSRMFSQSGNGNLVVLDTQLKRPILWDLWTEGAIDSGGWDNITKPVSATTYHDSRLDAVDDRKREGSTTMWSFLHRHHKKATDPDPESSGCWDTMEVLVAISMPTPYRSCRGTVRRSIEKRFSTSTVTEAGETLDYAIGLCTIPWRRDG